MAIRMMTSREHYEADPTDIEVVTNYHGHEAGRIYHGKDCPQGKEGAEDNQTERCVGKNCCGPCEPLYMRTTYRGKVLSLGEYNGYHDSDFYAVVWDDEQGRPKRVQYATTRGWTYPNGAAVDADEETLAKYEAYCEARRAEARAMRAKAHRAEIIERAKSCDRGKMVRVFKGRKVPIGTEGLCFWAKEGPYGLRVGIATSDKKDENGRYVDVAWTYGKNCEAIDWKDHLPENFKLEEGEGE